MKKFNKVAAQGDLFIRQVESVPNGWTKKQDENGKHIVAHSETGHHHVIDADETEYYINENDQMKAYLVVKNIIGKALDHLRSFDTHESIMIPPGIYELRRQREHTPQGWRQVQD